MYHLGYIVCILCSLYTTHHTLTQPGHPARNRQNNQPPNRPTLRSHLTPHSMAGPGPAIINCPFWQYWNSHKKKLGKTGCFPVETILWPSLDLFTFWNGWMELSSNNRSSQYHSLYTPVGIFFWINNVWFFSWGSSGLRLLFQAPFNFLCQEAKTERNLICSNKCGVDS